MLKVISAVIAIVVPFLVIVGVVILNNDSATVEQPAIVEGAPGPNEVFMLAGRYEPAELNVKVGDTVTFINKDSEDHWPASDDHPSHQKFPELDPKKIVAPGESWQFTFDKPGRWEMHDHIFPLIRSVVIVLSN